MLQVFFMVCGRCRAALIVVVLFGCHPVGLLPTHLRGFCGNYHRSEQLRWPAVQFRLAAVFQQGICATTLVSKLTIWLSSGRGKRKGDHSYARLFDQGFVGSQKKVGWFQLRAGTHSEKLVSPARERRYRATLNQRYVRTDRLPSISLRGDFSRSRESALLKACFDKVQKGESCLPKGIRGIRGMSGQKYRSFVNRLIAEYPDPRYLEVG